MASFGGLDRCTSAVNGHAAATLVKSFVEGIPAATRDARVTAMLEQRAAQVRDGFAQSPLQLSAARALLRRPMAIGLGRPTILGIGPSLALVVDEGNSGAEIDALLSQLASARPEPTRVQKGSAAGVACTLVEGEGMPTLYAVHHDGAFVFTNSEGYLREILAVRSQQQPSLAAGSSLGSQRARLLEDPLVEMFVNVAPMLPMVEPLLPYEAADFGRALGIESLGGAYLAAGPSSAGTVETIDIQVRGNKDGLLKAALSGQVDFEAAKFFSKDTLAFAGLRLDANAAAAAFDRFCSQLPRDQARDARRDAARDFLRGFREAGMSDAEIHELFASIDGSISVGFSLGNAPAPIPEAVAIAKIRDAAVVGKHLDSMRAAMAKQGLEWKVRMQGDTQVHYCSAPIGEDSGLQLTPSYAIHEGCLVIGSTTKALLDAMKQRADETTSLFRETDFVAAALADEGAMAFVHLRPGRFCERYWRTAEARLFPLIDDNQEELGFSSVDLPEPEAFAKALGSMSWSITCDEDGMRLRMRGNVGLGGAAASFAALVDDVLLRAKAKAY